LESASVKGIDKKLLARRNRIRINLWCWAFLLPALIFYVLFQGWPIVASFYYSFLNWSGLTTTMEWVGLDNYKALLGDERFWNAFGISFKYAIFFVPTMLAVSLIFAYVLNKDSLKGRKIYRTLYFVPVITTPAIVGIVMVFIWSVQGPINYILVQSGLLERAYNFLGTNKSALGTVLFISIWKNMGIYMIYWLAGLQSVPKEVIEAATIDGASERRIFFSIVMPLIKPIAGVIAILCFINALKVFDIIKTMTDGGPFYSTDVVATFIYRMAFSSEMGLPRLGYASSAATVFGAVVILIGLLTNSVKNRLEAKRMI